MISAGATTFFFDLDMTSRAPDRDRAAGDGLHHLAVVALGHLFGIEPAPVFAAIRTHGTPCPG